MAKDNKKTANQNACSDPLACKRGKIGGEAVLEGIMMKAGGMYSIALRQQDQKIRISDHKYTTIRDKHKLLRLPIIRGVVNMVESFILSYKVLGISADAYDLEEEEPSKFEKWLEKTFGKSILDIIMVFAGVLGVVLGFGLFFYLPMLATKGLDALTGGNEVAVVLMDDGDNQLITFGAAGYASLESDLGTRTVKRIKINSAKEVVISIEDPAGP